LASAPEPGAHAHEFNRQLFFLGREPDRLDRRTYYLGGLRLRRLAFVRFSILGRDASARG
jgi:hypothetical protein